MASNRFDVALYFLSALDKQSTSQSVNYVVLRIKSGTLDISENGAFEAQNFAWRFYIDHAEKKWAGTQELLILLAQRSSKEMLCQFRLSFMDFLACVLSERRNNAETWTAAKRVLCLTNGTVAPRICARNLVDEIARSVSLDHKNEFGTTVAQNLLHLLVSADRFGGCNSDSCLCRTFTSHARATLFSVNMCPDWWGELFRKFQKQASPGIYLRQLSCFFGDRLDWTAMYLFYHGWRDMLLPLIQHNTPVYVLDTIMEFVLQDFGLYRDDTSVRDTLDSVSRIAVFKKLQDSVRNVYSRRLENQTNKTKRE